MQTLGGTLPLGTGREGSRIRKRISTLTVMPYFFKKQTKTPQKL